LPKPSDPFQNAASILEIAGGILDLLSAQINVRKPRRCVLIVNAINSTTAFTPGRPCNLVGLVLSGVTAIVSLNANPTIPSSTGIYSDTAMLAGHSSTFTNNTQIVPVYQPLKADDYIYYKTGGTVGAVWLFLEDI
jgi:hypothetical protein